MADRFPLILNTSTNQIQEIPSGDNLDLTGVGINNVGVITSGNVQIGGATTDLVVTGDARITGILTVGTGSLTLDGPNNLVNVGTALTLGHTQGLQFHTQNLHSAGFEVNQINVSGASTIGGNLDANGDLDVDGHTNLDNLSVAGVSTFVGNINGKDIILTDTTPAISFIDSNANSDYRIIADNGVLSFADITNNANRINLQSNGTVAVQQHLDVGAGVDVTGNATVTGNLSVGGVLTYEDVTNVDSVGLITARSGINLTGGNINLGDSGGASDDRIVFGADTDMFMYHNGSHGVITNTTGNLHILDDVIKLQNANSTTRLEVTTGGVIVTGTLDVTGSIDSTVAGADNTLTLETTSSGDPKIQFNAAGAGGHRIEYLRSSLTLNFTNGTSNRLQITAAGHTIPGTDSLYDLGLTGTRWRNVYADTLYGDGSNLTGLNTDLVNDTSPQLGADLDTNSHHILLDDSHAVKWGNSTELEIQHTGSSGYAAVHNAVGNFLIDTTGNFYVRDTSGSKTAILSNPAGATTLYHNNVPKLETNANAVNIKNSANSWSTISRAANGYFGFAFNEGNTTYAYLGVTGGGSEIGQYVPGGNEIVLRSQSNIHLYSGYNTRLLTTDSNAMVSLYYGGSLKFQTQTSGAKVTGTSEVTESVKCLGSSNAGQTVVMSSGAARGSSIGVTNTHAAGIFWSTSDGYGIYKTAGPWSGNYQQLNIEWITGIHLNGGTSYGLSGVRFSSHALPTANNTYDLGNGSLRWRNVYTNDLNLSNEGGANDVDNTWGDYTIQEGESDLFLINNRSGKKYKFNLTEVS